MAEGLCAYVDRPQAKAPTNPVPAAGHFGRRYVDRRPVHFAALKVFDLLGDAARLAQLRRPVKRRGLSGDRAAPPDILDDACWGWRRR